MAEPRTETISSAKFNAHSTTSPFYLSIAPSWELINGSVCGGCQTPQHLLSQSREEPVQGSNPNTARQIRLCLLILHPNVLLRRSNYSDFYFLVNNHICHNWFHWSKAPSWQSWRPEPMCQLCQGVCKQKLRAMEKRGKKKKTKKRESQAYRCWGPICAFSQQ